MTNCTNGKIYIGKTVDVKKRVYKHSYLAKKNFSRPFYDVIRAVGIESFDVAIIEECTKETEEEREKYWIAFFNSTNKNIGYNRTIGGAGGNTWTLNENKSIASLKLSIARGTWVLSEESRNKISLALKGRIISQKARDKVSKTLKAKYATGELKVSEKAILALKILCNRKGSHHSEEAKEKLRAYRKGNTYENMYGHEKAEVVKTLSRERWVGSKNINYKEIDMELAAKLLSEGLSNDKVAKILNITPQTLWGRCKKEFNITPGKYREEAIKK